MQIEIQLRESLKLDEGDQIFIDYEPGKDEAYVVFTKPKEQLGYGSFQSQEITTADVTGYTEEGDLYQ